VLAFRRALSDLGLGGRIIAADPSESAPTLYLADAALLTPASEAPDYLDVLLEFCERQGVGLVIPLADEDLEGLARACPRFAEAGVRILVSPPWVVETCRDGLRLADFLKRSGVLTPEVMTYQRALDGPFPLVLKQRLGAAAHRIRRIPDREALAACWSGDDGTIIQPCVKGDPFIVDVYAGLGGPAKVAVPRRQYRVCAREARAAQTVRHPEIIGQALRLGDALKECVGVMAIRCRLTPAGEVVVTEVAPHLDDGAALSIRAGADFPRWIIQEHLGQKPDCDPEVWQDGLVGLRHDAEVFRRSDQILTPWPSRSRAVAGGRTKAEMSD